MLGLAKVLAQKPPVVDESPKTTSAGEERAQPQSEMNDSQPSVPAGLPTTNAAPPSSGITIPFRPHKPPPSLLSPPSISRDEHQGCMALEGEGNRDLRASTSDENVISDIPEV
jgi:hypothetical protein